MGGFSSDNLFGLTPQAAAAMRQPGMPPVQQAPSWQSYLPQQSGGGGGSSKVSDGTDPFMKMFQRLIGPSSKQVGTDLGEMQGITGGFGPAAPAPAVSDVSGLGSVADGSNPWMSLLGSLLGG